ncbi:ribokinase [Blautia schinkii]|nr:ribokinase [Blautia schinkii]
MKISVVGSINMDQTVTAERIPLKGETLSGGNLTYIPGGKGANQAVAMARLGADVEMFGCVGKDEHGTKLIENLTNAGVKTGHIRRIPGVPTGLALITVGENDNTIIVVAGANDQVDRSYVDSVKEELLRSDFVVLQHEIPADTIEYVIELCSQNGIKVVLNPGPARPVKPEILSKVTYLTPNEHEAKILFGADTDTEELLKKYPEKLVITLGSKGVAAGLQDGSIFRVPVRPAKVADTTGAGDTLNGAFCVKLAEGADIREALHFANTAASLSTEKFGAQTGMPTREEVEKALGGKN